MSGHYIQSMMNTAADDIEDFMRQLRGWAEGTSAQARAVWEPAESADAREARSIEPSGNFQAKTGSK
ncbi:hypothetical protein [Azospirillum endophyticum]